jgi:acetyltransferase-like isoleucine patch superfamily enzyme
MLHFIFKKISSFHLFCQKAWDRILMYFYREQFASCGKNVVFFPTKSFFFYKTIKIGNDVYIGPGATFSASKSFIQIGSKVMFGPNVTIMGGDHNTSVIGAYMYDVNEKLPENDLPVTIKDDVWIGADAIILKGVTIGQGSIVAAGSLVIADVSEYSVAGGVPAKILRKRFNDNQMKDHVLKIKEKS